MKLKGVNVFFSIVLFGSFIMPVPSFGAQITSSAQTVSQIFERAKENTNWKAAFLTGENAQVVFMNISPETNAKNEVGSEIHKFDQIIFIAEGSAKAVLNGREFVVKPGDMIFIPQGVQHNVINLDTKKPLKIMSVYSERDIPANSKYKTVQDVTKKY